MRVQARAGAAAPKHIKADKAGWIKSGRRGRVKFLRGEEKLRHATLQDGNEDEDATGSGRGTAPRYSVRSSGRPCGSICAPRQEAPEVRLPFIHARTGDGILLQKGECHGRNSSGLLGDGDDYDAERGGIDHTRRPSQCFRHILSRRRSSGSDHRHRRQCDHRPVGTAVSDMRPIERISTGWPAHTVA